MQTEKISKRKWLNEIVKALGPDATAERIREDAYKTGFGKVSTLMLVFVRNELWPERKKRPGGFTREQRTERAAAELLCKLVPCPKCESANIWVMSSYRPKRGGVTRHRWCQECGHKYQTWHEVDDGKIRSRRARNIRWAITKEIACTYCKNTKPVADFSFRTGSDIQRRPGCKECYAKIRFKTGFKRILDRHGLTQEQYDAMVFFQGGKCAICRTAYIANREAYQPGKTGIRSRRVVCIDHCHATGKVRGLLCCRCNLGIGNFGDDLELMRAAITYIETHRGETDA